MSLNQHSRPIRTRDLDRKILISDFIETIDPDNPGTFKPTWTPLGNGHWAKITPGSGRERMYAGRLTGSTMMSFIIRFDRRVTTRCKITWDGRDFNIRDVSDYGEHHFYMELMCEEGVAQ